MPPPQPVKKKQLFDDDDFAPAPKAEKKKAPADDGLLKVNLNYASKYDTVKRKKELQQLTNKYGKDISSSDEETEDSDAELITVDKEEAFVDVLHKLRTNHPSIHDKNYKFFQDDLDEASSVELEGEDEDEGDTHAHKVNEGSNKKKKFTLKDEYTRAVVEGDDAADEVIPEETVQKALKKGPKTAEEKALKDSFLAAVDGTADDFVVKKKKLTPKEQAEEDKRQAEIREKMKKALLEAPSAGGKKPRAARDDDAFLAEYFANNAWKGDGDSDDDVAGYNLEQLEADDADEMFYDEAEKWEQDFSKQQYRHEIGDAAFTIQSFPRDPEGLLRQKDSTRKEARQRKKEREEEQALKAQEELKRLKHLKRQEIEEHKKLISEVAGLQSRKKKEDAKLKELLANVDLTEDYDPAKFDEMMGKLFNEDYYDEDDEDFQDPEDESVGTDDEIGEPVAVPSNSVVDDLSFLYPTAAIEKSQKKAAKQKNLSGGGPVMTDDGRTLEDLEKDLDAKMDEYWRLHYNNIVGGVRTRFKYTEVNPENFGFTDEDILTLDDRTLNMQAPLNAYAPYLSKEDNVKDRYKAIHRRKNLRMLPAERKSRRYKNDTVVLNPEMEDGEEVAKKVEQAAKKIARDLEDPLIEQLGERAAKKPRKEQRRPMAREPLEGFPQPAQESEQDGGEGHEEGQSRRRKPRHRKGGQSQEGGQPKVQFSR